MNTPALSSDPASHPPLVRIGSALFNADHSRLGEELRRMEGAKVDFWHLDVFDGYFVPDQGFPARTIYALRNLTRLPFEIHLAVREPLRFLGPLREAGADLVFLPAESTPLLYEAVFAVRELGLKAGLCLALGTPLSVLEPALPLLDSVLLLGRVTGEGKRGRDFNELVIERVRTVRALIEKSGASVDLQAAGGLETATCVQVCAAGATSLPLGAALHRERDPAAFIAFLRSQIGPAARAAAVGAPSTDAVEVQVKPGRGPCRILVASRSFGKGCPEILERLKAAGCVFLGGFEMNPSEENLVQRIGEADVLISGTEPVTAKVLAAAARLRLIAKHGVGYDNIDIEAAGARGIAVALAGPAMVDSVADLALGLLLAAARRIPQGNASVKAGRWTRFVGPELAGKTLGIVGLGQIGKAVCRRAIGFGMNVIATDARPDQSFARSWNVECVGLPDLLRRSDFVTLHAPSTSLTRRLLGPEQLAAMKPSAFLVNTARGDLVDETALYEALRDKRLAGAATDVFVQEPPGAHPLLSLDNFIAMPHCAGQTPEALRRMGENTAENILRMLAGKDPRYLVNGQ